MHTSRWAPTIVPGWSDQTVNDFGPAGRADRGQRHVRRNYSRLWRRNIAWSGSKFMAHHQSRRSHPRLPARAAQSASSPAEQSLGHSLAIDDKSYLPPCQGYRELVGATDFEHGQLAPFARSGTERNGLIDRKSKKRRTDRRQHRHAPVCDIGIKRINQNDLLTLSGLFVSKFDFAADTDDIST